MDKLVNTRQNNEGYNRNIGLPWKLSYNYLTTRYKKLADCVIVRDYSKQRLKRIKFFANYHDVLKLIYSIDIMKRFYNTQFR